MASWRDNLLPAKLGGVPFEYRSVRNKTGRRVEVHEFAGRDDPFVEDLGRMARTHTVEAFVVGENYAKAADDLLKRLESKDAQIFQHPYRGPIMVNVVGEVEQEENIDAGRMASFTFSFVESGFKTYRVILNTPAVVHTIAVDAASKLAKKTKLKFLKAIGAVLASIAKGLQTAATKMRKINGKIAAALSLVENITAAIEDFEDTIVVLLNTPQAIMNDFIALATSVMGLISNFVPDDNDGNVTSSPDLVGLATASLDSMFGFVSVPEVIQTPTEQNSLETEAHRAITNTVKTIGLIAATDTLAQLELESADQASQIIDSLSEKFDEMIESDLDTDVHESLFALKAAAIEHFTKTATALPHVRQYEVPQTGAALRIAYELYGDASQDEDIIRRNKIRHPAFISGGSTIEVLVP